MKRARYWRGSHPADTANSTKAGNRRGGTRRRTGSVPVVRLHDQEHAEEPEQRDKDDQTGDAESRTKLPDQEQLRFPAPYGYRYESIYVPDYIRRINLFRKTEIHCIGIGEVGPGTLQAVARNALDGDVKMVGK